MTIQAVFFDMGGTIETFNYTRALRLGAIPGLRQLLVSVGIGLPLQDDQLLDVISDGLRRYHQWRMQTLVELPTFQIWREYILAGYPVDLDGLESVAEELALYIETRFYRRAMRPEIPTVLETIRQMGLKIGLISNVSSRGQVPINLKQYGIYHYFDPIVLSSEYGQRKPGPAIFYYAARLANVPTSQCLYVGDRIARDVLGARRAGYRLAIQIRHDYEHGEQDEGAIPDAVIDQMTELLDILRVEAQPPVSDPVSVISTPDTTRAILFDAGDVLSFRPNRGCKFAAFLKELSLDTEKNHLAEKRTLTEQAFVGQITQMQYRQAILRLYGVTQPEQIARGLSILDDEDNDVHFFAGVSQTLKTLKQKGYLLGIITDTANPVYIKLNWFEKNGMGAVWDSIISSHEIGMRKPCPAIYHAALRQLGLRPGQSVFVGHKASELAGARAVGMKTVAFNFDPEAQADFYIERFADLLTIPFML
ncbi:MAG: HAD family hydrolase [Anaerolineales bacterium]|nr:HAD family hydrolase [Anaerolineales bacterium]